MTAQIAEKLNYEGRKLSMCSEPLRAFFALGGYQPAFQSNSSALWRGYVGEWDIKDKRFYMIGLRGVLVDGTDASLESVFPGFPDRVFAHWYSGTIRIPQGKILEYVHMGYGSTYESDLMIDIEKGVVVSAQVIHNGVSEEDGGAEGYGIGGMTVFPRSKHSKGYE